MLDVLLSNSPYKSKHLEILELVDLLVPSKLSDTWPSEGDTLSKKGGRIKMKSKKSFSLSPLKVKAKNRTKIGESSQ